MLRIGWVDQVKGFAILLVVVGHVWRGLNTAGMMEADVFRSIEDRIYIFHMPLFFVISGLFFVNVLGKADVASFFKSRLVRLIYPMVLWTYIFIALKLVGGTMNNTQITFDEFFSLPIPGRWHFWFLWALFVMHIGLYPFKAVLTSGPYKNAVLIALLIVSIVATMFPLSGQVYYWIGSAKGFLPYFILGMVIGTYKSRLTFSPAIGVLAAVVFAGILWAVPLLNGGGVPRLVTAAVLSLLAIAAFIGLNGHKYKVLPIFGFLGGLTMVIFLSHTIFTAATRGVLLRLGVSDLTLHLLLGTAAGILFPILLNWVAKRWRLQKLLGI